MLGAVLAPARPQVKWWWWDHRPDRKRLARGRL